VVETEVWKWLRQQSKDLYAAMEQMYQCSWRIYREINVFCRFEYHIFYVLYTFVTYLVTLPHMQLLSIVYGKLLSRCYSPKKSYGVLSTMGQSVSLTVMPLPRLLYRLSPMKHGAHPSVF
jgi:hypothetical protein